MYLSANYAHHTIPSPTTGTARRYDACIVIIGKLRILTVDKEKDAILLQLLLDFRHTSLIWEACKHSVGAQCLTKLLCCAKQKNYFKAYCITTKIKKKKIISKSTEHITLFSI